MQVFQEPDTAGAMHGGQVELHMRLVLIPEAQEFHDHLLIVEVGEPVIGKPSLGFDTRVLFKVVIVTEVVFVEQEEYLLTAFTAKEFLLDLYRSITSFPTMVTGMLHWLTFAQQISKEKGERGDDIGQAGQ